MSFKEQNKKKTTGINLKAVLVTVAVSYLLLAVLFYYLSGNQLHFRPSRGNIESGLEDAVTVELARGEVVEQYFTTKIHRLESVAVQWGTYGRPDAGTVTMELVRASDDSVVLREQFDAALVSELQFMTMNAPQPIEGLCNQPLILRVYSDSEVGSALTPMMCSTLHPEGFTLRLNGTEAEGTLCFTARGTDYIWIGLHYWKLIALFGAALLLCLVLAYRRVLSGRHSYIINAIYAMKKYRFLIQQLVSRDFKTKYKRSVLGVFWSFLNPLMMMMVQYFVFSTIFRSDVPNFAAYLIIGTVMFNFFSESIGMSLMSILGNANLITKVYMPKYIYPLTRVLSSLVNLAISLIPMLIVCLLTGIHFQKSAILALFFIFCLVVFCLGMGFLLSTSMVFFRDTQFLWNVLCMMWMYATPIFYPETIIPDNLRFVLRANPMYHFIKNTRICIMNGIAPEPMEFIRCLAIAAVALLIGAIIFRKNQDRFVLYL